MIELLKTLLTRIANWFKNIHCSCLCSCASCGCCKQHCGDCCTNYNCGCNCCDDNVVSSEYANTAVQTCNVDSHSEESDEAEELED